jgi:hypothetical protein
MRLQKAKGTGMIEVWLPCGAQLTLSQRKTAAKRDVDPGTVQGCDPGCISPSRRTWIGSGEFFRYVDGEVNQAGSHYRMAVHRKRA